MQVGKTGKNNRQKDWGAMAKPIKETPILHGKDAERFQNKIKENESRKVSRAEYERVMTNYKRLSADAKYDK
ncbi:MAG: hypothetical protein P8Y75_13165 [Nitrospirota bacterium]|jgi:hypothetical protein